jgi:hypothetical protein
MFMTTPDIALLTDALSALADVSREDCADAAKKRQSALRKAAQGLIERDQPST